MESCKSFGRSIVGFHLLGEEGSKQRVASLTYDGYVLLKELDFEKKVGYVTGYLKLRLDQELEEWTKNFAVCPQNRYVLVEVDGFEKKSVDRGVIYSSRMVILEIRGSTLIQKASTGAKNGPRNVQSRIMTCCGYSGSGRHIVWLTLTSGEKYCKEKGLIQLYDYDTVIGELREMKEVRIIHWGASLKNIHRFGN